MKKIIFSIICVISLFSCKNTEHESAESSNEAAVAQDSTIVTARTVKSAAQTTQYPVIVVLNKAGLNSQWRSTPPQSGAILKEDTTKFYVDVTLIGTTNTLANWLKDHDTHISFDDIYGVIESRHLIAISPILLADIPVNDADYASITFNDLKQRAAAFSTPMSFTDKTKFYDQYIKISISGGQVVVQPSGVSTTETIYSVPLFNAIVKNHNLTNPTFQFARIEIDGNETIFFRVKELPNVYGHYDFSNKPPILSAMNAI